MVEIVGKSAMPCGSGAAYPDGLFIAQDGNNTPAAQNFKLVGWQTVKAALGR